jgi:hypothetical protein
MNQNKLVTWNYFQIKIIHIIQSLIYKEQQIKLSQEHIKKKKKY